jgi:hypothetical protein
MVNMFVTTISAIGEVRFKQAQARHMCVFRGVSLSTRLHRPHSAQIERQANEFELGFYLVQAPHTELAKPQHVLEPPIVNGGLKP